MGGGGWVQFNGKTILLLKHMQVYADIRPKELNVNKFSETQAYLARVYCKNTGYGENNFVLFY